MFCPKGIAPFFPIFKIGVWSGPVPHSVLCTHSLSACLCFHNPRVLSAQHPHNRTPFQTLVMYALVTLDISNEERISNLRKAQQIQKIHFPWNSYKDKPTVNCDSRGNKDPIPVNILWVFSRIDDFIFYPEPRKHALYLLASGAARDCQQLNLHFIP